MNIGFKIFSPDQVELLEKFSDYVDFVEIMAVQSYRIDAFDGIKLPIYIHCEHEDFGINLPDLGKEQASRQAISHSLKLADRLKAIKVVVHPGYIDNDKCSEDQAIKILSGFNDDRIIIENMPVKGANNYLCRETESIGNFMARSGKGFCLDFGHATLAAKAGNNDPAEFVESLVGLGPVYYHISDTIYAELDDHRHLGRGDSPLKQYLKLIPWDSYVTVETAKENEQVMLADIRYLREFESIK